MKKSTVYIIIAALAGLLVGYLFFGNSDSNTNSGDAHDHAAETANQMWTCSMHPQIMQPEAGDCPICGMDLIPADISADGLRPDQFTMTENALALANVQTTIVGDVPGSADTSISLSGKIAVNEETIAVQASYFDGRIEELHVNYEGQEIQKGQLLATIYSPELVAAQQELLTAASLKEAQPQLYTAVRKKLKLWKLSEDQINTIESSGKVQENMPVYATVSGTVSEVMRIEGDYVQKGQPIARVSNLNTVWAEFDVYEGQLSMFKTGQEISITTKAYPNKKHDARITFIDPVLDNDKRTVSVRATLDNQGGIFKPGVFVSGTVKTGNDSAADSSLSIPSSAVMWTGERSVVYVKVSADKPVFEMREVMIGARSGDQIEITSGLDSGEEIVTNGTFTIDAAAQLQGKKSMMNSKEAPSGNVEELNLPEAFQDQFVAVLPIYLQMKDAFVASQGPEVAKKAQKVLDQMNELDPSVLGAMEKEYLNTSIQLLQDIAAKTSLEGQRDHFVHLNEHFVVLTSHMDSLGQTYYVQRCPMANNNKGAIWLSAEEEIRNPYYGDEMLTCGKVELVLE